MSCDGCMHNFYKQTALQPPEMLTETQMALRYANGPTGLQVPTVFPEIGKPAQDEAERPLTFKKSLFKANFQYFKELVNGSETPDPIGNEPKPDIHIGGSRQDLKKTEMTNTCYS